ncbi:methylated-DNA--[protein]-cysteine S-methyltransferase [Muribacter muris]|uniref:methylated-DNA--[protein]-cysteine S-methyltransferase n=1 Tax=Muribacter muris TaxID=67855 RepID=A0A4Y9JYM3_9PAST|nr:methylated-DNA--[protein]-cysteine S-methyltransferase [Muribacter muris]MBF0785344.1 methylated-DNA--[protein]-cysteine S-methyltransferase [Muribacter muris]MBF0825999.1 methylated-DNA--[protein]-cysteine S-methyltransferase [Muribacter muris]TFV09607.1 methylated-DNA--[protein]-cysteine S-methyltransferase [Muribacter muris]
MLFSDQLICPESFPWKFADIISSDTSIVSILFSNKKLDTNPNDITHECKLQLSKYFNKELVDFELPLIEAKSNFFKSVYIELLRTPCGITTTYKKIAKNLGSAKKARAVGLACASNQISIIIPYHRVLNSANQLNGYAGGLSAKAWLLEHEKNF